MATEQLAAQIAHRDLWMAAAELDMRDAPRAEVAKVCFLVSACGLSPEEAKQEVRALRGTADTSKDKTIFAVRLPKEWTEKVRPTLAGLSSSQLLRFSLARIIDDSDETALRNAERRRGRPRKEATAA
jgi:hypothetical protein